MNKINEIYLGKLLDMCNSNNIIVIKSGIEYYRFDELLQKCYEQQTIITYTYSIDINSIDTSTKINIYDIHSNFTNLLIKLKGLHELIDFITFLMINTNFVEYYNDKIIHSNPTDKLSELKFNKQAYTIELDDLIMFQGSVDNESTSSTEVNKSINKNGKSNKHEILYIEEYSN
jgi:hypothetical protein